MSISLAEPQTKAAPSVDRKAMARAALLDGALLPTLLKLALPTMVVLVAQTAVNVAEAYYVGFLGTDALAGVALVFPVFMLMMTMSGGGLGSGVASAVARAVGAGRQKDADALVLHAVVLAILFGATFTLGLRWGGPVLFHALGGRQEALDAAVAYSNTIFAGAIAVWIVNLIAAALRGSGNVKLPAMVTLIGAAVLIPASPAFIFGFGPIPRLGIAGAGLAFALYYGGAALVMLRYLMTGRTGLQLRFVPLQGRLFSDILKVGLPSAINTVQTNLAPILVTGAVGLFGISAIAGYGIASRLDYLMIPILFGLSTSVLTMVGVNMGAGRVTQARRAAWIAGLIGAGLTEAIGLVVALFPAVWIHLFSREADVIAPAQIYLQSVAPFYGAYGLAFVLGFAAQGAGRVLWPFLSNTMRLLVSAGLGWIAVTQFGAGMPALALIVAASYVVQAVIIAAAMTSRGIWRPAKA
jgi:putative MATE family efflux protein